MLWARNLHQFHNVYNTQGRSPQKISEFCIVDEIIVSPRRNPQATSLIQPHTVDRGGVGWGGQPNLSSPPPHTSLWYNFTFGHPGTDTDWKSPQWKWRHRICEWMKYRSIRSDHRSPWHERERLSVVLSVLQYLCFTIAKMSTNGENPNNFNFLDGKMLTEKEVWFDHLYIYIKTAIMVFVFLIWYLVSL